MAGLISWVHLSGNGALDLGRWILSCSQMYSDRDGIELSAAQIWKNGRDRTQFVDALHRCQRSAWCFQDSHRARYSFFITRGLACTFCIIAISWLFRDIGWAWFWVRSTARSGSLRYACRPPLLLILASLRMAAVWKTTLNFIQNLGQDKRCLKYSSLRF